MAPDRPQLPPSAVEELGFWEGELTGAGKHPEVVRARLDPATRESEFPPFLSAPILPMLAGHFETSPLRCLELGPGPLSSLAWGVEQGLLDVTAVDVLAVEFCELLERHGHGDYPVKPVPGRGETLLEQFGEEGFHLTFVRNALDHTDDLPLAFDNLVKCTKPGGALVLCHHLNEGSHQEWSDSHHWNLDLSHAGLRAQDRSGTWHELADRKDLELVYLSYRGYLLDGWIDAIYQRV
jgi:SAM-dependent methyltransferase